MCALRPVLWQQPSTALLHHSRRDVDGGIGGGGHHCTSWCQHGRLRLCSLLNNGKWHPTRCHCFAPVENADQDRRSALPLPRILLSEGERGSGTSPSWGCTKWCVSCVVLGRPQKGNASGWRSLTMQLSVSCQHCRQRCRFVSLPRPCLTHRVCFCLPLASCATRIAH